jgi:phosphatidylserine/phosphatidylglycerophosphate/cardiolipin synthase-like enzyme
MALAVVASHRTRRQDACQAGVADRHVLFVSSANLTQSGVAKNIEAGLLVRGGAAPLRAAEHVDALRASGALTRLI